jgi:cyclase
VTMYLRFAIFLIVPVLLFTTIVHARDSVNTTARTVTKIAEGIFVIRHPDAPSRFPQSNTTVIVGDREVMVVDTTYLPSAAREDLAEIRKLTNKPIRYVVNTHWHLDHVMGNAVYLEAFPKLSIIAHKETAKQSANYYPGILERFPQRAETYKKLFESGKGPDDKQLSDEEKTFYSQLSTGTTEVYKEYIGTPPKFANVILENDLNLDLGGRKVQIRFLGRGNTAGDAVVYLPKEKILIAGDLLPHPVPYFFGGYPTELSKTLKRMEQIDFQTIVPGHGDVLNAAASRKYLAQVIEVVDVVVGHVSSEIDRVGGGSTKLEVVREGVMKKVDVATWRLKFAGLDRENQEFFDSSFPGLITYAYAELMAR